MIDFSNEQTHREMVREVESRILQMTDEEYFKDIKKCTNSMLLKLDQSPLHLQYYLNSRQIDKQHQIFGKALHCAILEPDQFEKRYYVLDDTIICNKIGGAKPRGTTKYKQWKEDFLTHHGALTEVSMDEYSDILSIQERIFNIPEISSMLNSCKKEVVLHDKYNDVERKGKLDAVRFGDFVLDLKSTKDPVSEFKKTIFNHKIHQQGAFYAGLAGVKDVVILAVEKTAPYSIGLFKLSSDTIEAGEERVFNLIQQYKKYYKDGKQLMPFNQVFTKQVV